MKDSNINELCEKLQASYECIETLKQKLAAGVQELSSARDDFQVAHTLCHSMSLNLTPFAQSHSVSLNLTQSHSMSLSLTLTTLPTPFTQCHSLPYLRGNANKQDSSPRRSKPGPIIRIECSLHSWESRKRLSSVLFPPAPAIRGLNDLPDSCKLAKTRILENRDRKAAGACRRINLPAPTDF